MSEWVPVLAVFWLLWALDGVRLAKHAVFSFVGGAGTKRFAGGARSRFSRVSLPGPWPADWRIPASDVPFALSPAGICNFPAGAAGRPGSDPVNVIAHRWEEIREVGVSQGWLFINGARFCPYTGHLPAPELLRLALLPGDRREARVRWWIARWFRPAHVARRVRVLRSRSVVAVILNWVTGSVIAAITVYVGGDVASRLPAPRAAMLATALPWVLLSVCALHFVAVGFSWMALKKLKAVTAQKRGTTLLSALLLPPQALRLRMLLGDGYFPSQHPLAVAVAVPNARTPSRLAFNVLTDLRWPLRPIGPEHLTHEVLGWFRSALSEVIEPMLQQAGISADSLLLAPVADGAATCSYCPRCHDQFRDPGARCPNGISLLPVRRSPAEAGPSR
jgi:hypothetical protein